MDEKHRFLGLRAYGPRHVETVEELMTTEAERLRGLLGLTLQRSYAVWDESTDRWWTDAPVVLDFGVTRLELAAFRLHVCISWDSIDMTDAINWYGGSELQLEWRPDRVPELDAFRARTVDAIHAVEYRGVMSGLGLRSKDSYIELFNALDELGVLDTPDPDPEIRRIPI